MSSSLLSLTHKARLSTSAGVLYSSPSLQAASAVAAATSRSSSQTMSRFGRASKWAVVGTTALALGAAAASQMGGDGTAKKAKPVPALSETDKKYQELLNAYGSGESLDDLQNAVAQYGGSQPRG